MTKEHFSKRVIALEQTLFHISYGILKNVQDCEDVVQEAVLKAYANIDSLRNPAYFKTWLVRILLNECYRFLQKKAKEIPTKEELLEIGQKPSLMQEASVYIKEEYLDLYESMEKLEEADRICVQLFYLEGYSVREIARILQIPEGTVKSRLSRARKKLKQSLGGLL